MFKSYMPINASPHYERAEREYLAAETTEQKIRALKKMLSLAPKHKGAENLNAQLKRRLAKLRYTKEKEIKQKKGGKVGIKKEDMQAVIIGETNTGKSSLLSMLTNAKPDISPTNFSTKQPVVGMMDYQGVQIQIIENPAIESEYYDKGLTNSADILLIIVTDLEQIEKINFETKTSKAKRIIVFNLKKPMDKRKLEATLRSKKYNFVIINLSSGEGGLGGRGRTDKLKEKIFQSFDKIRIYTKEPGKDVEKDKPIVLNSGETVKDAAEKILHGFSDKIKETKIWGPSSKFPGQKVGLSHELKDLDVVEFKTR